MAAENVFCNDRILYLADDIDNSTTATVINNILNINKIDDDKDKKEKDYERNPIKLYIQSFGGSVYDMWSLIDVITNSKTSVQTYCTGYAMSAAFQIFLAGHKRYATEHTTFMYHQVNCVRSGKYQDLVEDREEMDYIQNKIEEYVIKQTKMTKEDLQDIRERKKDFYIHSDKAVDYGIVDEIIKG